jgi:hypothetical protein
MKMGFKKQQNHTINWRDPFMTVCSAKQVGKSSHQIKPTCDKKLTVGILIVVPSIFYILVQEKQQMLKGV